MAITAQHPEPLQRPAQAATLNIVPAHPRALASVDPPSMLDPGLWVCSAYMLNTDLRGGTVKGLAFSARKRKPFSGQEYSKVSPRKALQGFWVRFTPEYADTLKAVTSSSLSRLCGSAPAACTHAHHLVGVHTDTNLHPKFKGFLGIRHRIMMLSRQAGADAEQRCASWTALT